MTGWLPRLLAGIVLVATGSGFAAEPTRDQVLVIGKVTSSPEKNHRALKPIATYVAGKMTDLGIRESGVLIAKDNKQMLEFIAAGRVDWVTETVFSAVEFEETLDVELLLIKHRSGVARYHSVFFTHRDSQISSLADLAGKSIAFEDPGSTTGFRLPAAILLESGLSLMRLENPRATVPKNKVGYVFANAEINISAWVKQGLVDAGAYSNLDWLNPTSNPLNFRDELVIFERTPEIPRALELVRKNLDPAIKARLQQVLLTAHEDPMAKPAMQAYRKATRFERLDTKNDSTMTRINSMRTLLRRELGL